MNTTATTTTTTAIKTKESYEGNAEWKTRTIWVKFWNKEAVFIEDRLGKFRSIWIPRTAIRAPKFDRKIDFGKDETYYVYEVEINEDWWNAHVRFRGFEFETSNGHRKSWWS